MSESTSTENVSRRKISIAWQYFTETDHPNTVKCMQCNKKCSFKRKSTGNLIRHMRLKHPKLYASQILHRKNMTQPQIDQHETHNAIHELTRANNKHSEDVIDTMQHENSVEVPQSDVVIEEQHTEAVAYYLMEQMDVNQARKIDNQIFKVIVKEIYPFSMTENQEFISFVNMLNSNYKLPSCQSLSGELLSKTYQSAVEQLKSTLKEIEYVALTIDRWISREDETFITVTAHYLSKDLKLQNSLLDCISFHKDSPVNIPVFLQELVGNWRVSDKIVAVVTKNDPIIVKAIEECNWQHISCFAHTLNTIIVSCLEEINDVTTKVRNIVNYFKRNQNAKAELKNRQNEMGITNIKLIRDTSDRWNSTFDMITSFLKNKDILQTQLIKDLPKSCKLSSNDWLILENALKLLVIFNTITVEICSEKIVSFSKVPYMLDFMLKHVTNIIENVTLPNKIKNMGEKLKKDLFEESVIIQANDIVCQSVLLDPRLKKRGFSENSLDTAYSSLLANAIALKKKIMHETWTAHSGVQESKQEYFIDVWREFRETEKMPEKDFTFDARAEIDAFLGEAYVNMKDNPMTYWGNETKQHKFPVLFEIVKSRLCVPASSVPCENIFSKTGNALVERRNFLSSKNLKEVLFLHYNL